MTTRKYKICIDPGHGGKDPGAVGPTGVQEKVITLAVAKQAASILSGAGIETVLTRSTDKHLGSTLNADLNARCRIANQIGADCFVSMHCNSAANRSAHGAEVYTSRGNTKADSLATAIISAMEKALPELSFRKDMSDGDSDKEAGFAVLNGTKMPAALVELAFISNPAEEGMLESPAFQQKAARAIAEGIADYLGIELPTNALPKICVGEKVLSGMIVDGTTYAPVRAIAEALGRKVVWDSKTRTVIVE